LIVLVENSVVPSEQQASRPVAAEIIHDRMALAEKPVGNLGVGGALKRPGSGCAGNDTRGRQFVKMTIAGNQMPHLRRRRQCFERKNGTVPSSTTGAICSKAKDVFGLSGSDALGCIAIYTAPSDKDDCRAGGTSAFFRARCPAGTAKLRARRAWLTSSRARPTSRH
jgi:hypothetical protein